MRTPLLVLALSLLAACNLAPGAGVEAEANVSPPLRGAFFASSETARVVTGDISIERGGVVFATGLVLYTRVLHPRQGSDLVSANGDSYAAIAVRPSDLQVEVRRVIDQVVPQGERTLCAVGRPTYVAFAYDLEATEITMLVFSGEEPPGPEATESVICGAFAYVAPDGARTREGVLLW